MFGIWYRSGMLAWPSKDDFVLHFGYPDAYSRSRPPGWFAAAPHGGTSVFANLFSVTLA